MGRTRSHAAAPSLVSALVTGFHRAFIAAVVVAAVGVVASFALIRRDDLEQPAEDVIDVRPALDLAAYESTR